MNAFLYDETGKVGFIGYLEYATAQRSTLKALGTDLSYRQESTLLLWIGEFAIIALFAAGAAFMLAQRPINDQINDWYDVVEYIGFVDWKHRKEFKKLLKKGDFVNAAKYVQMASDYVHGLDVALHRNQSLPDTDMVLVIREVSQGRFRMIRAMRGIISPKEFANFFHAIKTINMPQQANIRVASNAD